MKKYSFLLVMMWSLFSCVDSLEKERKYTVSGYLFKDCAETPIQNEKLFFTHIKRNLAGVKFSDAGSTVTNAEGYFEHTYDADFSGGSIKIERNNDLIVESFQVDGYLEKYYEYTVVSHPVRILTSDSLTESDTLFIGAEANREDLFYITGPFYNNQTFVVDSVGINIGLGEGFGMYPGGVETKIMFLWDIGFKNYDKTIHTHHTMHNKGIRDIPQIICGEGGEVVIDLDKR